MVLKTRKTKVNSPSTRTVAMSPTTTGRSSAETFVRSTSTIGADSSIPVTGTPFASRGTATRPVPIASSSAGPPPASSARASTTGSSISGADMPVPAGSS